MRRNKNNKIKLVALILLLVITIGYAVIRSGLNINGITHVQNASWDVHFENYQATSGSVTPTVEPSTTGNPTSVSYEVTLTKPGDYYEFTIDAVNSGSLDAMIESISSKLNGVEITPSTLPGYLEYSVTYEDGEPLVNNQQLLHNTTEKLKLRVKYRDNIEPTDLPSTVQDLSFDFTITYVQADSNATQVIHPRNIGLWVNDTKISDDSPEAIINAMLLDMNVRCLDDSEPQSPISNDYIDINLVPNSENDGDYVVQVANGLTIHGEVYVITNPETGDPYVYAGTRTWPPDSDLNLPPAPTVSKYLQLNNITLVNPQARYNGVTLEKSLEIMVAEALESINSECIKKLIGEPQVTQP